MAQLETSRAAAVDSAEAERRRIERDLHDGAQQRLVALAMDLGNARERLEATPRAGAQLVAEAHEEAKAALKELRDLVRGIHPVILEDRGLDAALSAVVARSPVPVRLDVDVAERPSAGGREHRLLRGGRGAHQRRPPRRGHHGGGHASRAAATGWSSRCATTAGAAPTRGRHRPARACGTGSTALGGRMHVVSPPGGPTTLLVELPCGS